ncbi:abscisate beta-glucosyltransferase-like [Neltuma alba]|uniref:abscisate beta-glucosyltransferase-like n=1 Tax=Neltuma alba TaxID=207710 RepID=UPI0010A43397|nr:abscisate beta-glucosyltransferase-like [Prosopis alba]
MVSATSPVQMIFFPFVGGGHQIPMIDTAIAFASHGGANSIIITTLSNSLQFHKSIFRHQQSGLPISILTLPPNVEVSDVDMSAGPATDTSVLQQPLRQLLEDLRPDAIVVDMFHRWSADVIDELRIPRIVFHGSGCFSRCVFHNVTNYGPHEKLGSDLEPFVVPGLPDPIELTRSQLPPFIKDPSQGFGRRKKAEENSFGTVTNSFYDLEPTYADYLRNVIKTRVWLVGPVSLCNKNTEDKTERGKIPTIDEQSCLNWLNSKEPKSVLYISFGSLARLPREQLKEIAYALESCDQPFIWVIGKIFKSSETEEEGEYNWLPDGFEQRMKETNRGLIIRGWAPQLLILEHKSVGGFMTHCGWNSTLEGLSSGVPMITWPLSAEQFTNEKLVTRVLKVGAEVGSREWVSWQDERRELVRRDKMEKAVKKVMTKSEEAEEMRERIRDIAAKARRAVDEGGTSYADIDALIHELTSRRQTCFKAN